ncbi:hypothetical protein COT42_03445 [Candidatus Saganbacteria bacterium CG08_land_8_20_14_0_20_45_16]|uniref:Uncharacterized protein n=1 Tax=Candidatus Saganbacteria bacterium CG08_land_8_20_14_0_20_45_16 TaxID=2014293 RepID=A0A2H0XZF2_UNCSA|nr:MAG: hypothetical protein COT42_03445 [Candidatus Saganbacteria bacterium CG08_land_8_20_14_0_20_45_16]
MKRLEKCPICEGPIDVAENARAGERFTCPHCFAQLALHKHKGGLVLGCVFCKENVFDPMRCGDCERRLEKKRLFEEGRL